MILSASRRTDIPAFYADWFINRLKGGYVYIPNPRNPNRMGKVTISPENVDCIVFWTKNPLPMMDKLYLIGEMGYQFYFQFTLTPYGKDVEKYLPDKSVLINTLKKLSQKLGKHRVRR